jgi:hypothetical protein
LFPMHVELFYMYNENVIALHTCYYYLYTLYCNQRT